MILLVLYSPPDLLAFAYLAETRGSIRPRKIWEAGKNDKDKDRFEARSSSTLPNLGFPPQIYEINTAGAFHEKTAGTVHRRDVDRGFDQMEKCIDAQQQYLCSLTNSVATLNDRVQSQSYSLLALQNSSILQERKAAIDTTMMYKSMLFNMMSEEEKTQAKAELKDLEMQKKEVEKELEDLRSAARGFAAPSLPPLQDAMPARPVQLSQQQTTSPFRNHFTSAGEPQPKTQTTNSSKRGAQNTESRSVPVKRTKFGA